MPIQKIDIHYTAPCGGRAIVQVAFLKTARDLVKEEGITAYAFVCGSVVLDRTPGFCVFERQ